MNLDPPEAIAARRAFTLALLIVAFVAPVTAWAASIEVGQNYTAMRSALLAGGWEPVQSSDCEPLFVCSEYPEAESCNTSGANMYCLFNWSRAKARLQILTSGEENPIVIEIRK
jgi:hypothetical protein